MGIRNLQLKASHKLMHIFLSYIIDVYKQSSQRRQRQSFWLPSSRDSKMFVRLSYSEDIVAIIAATFL